MKPFFAALLLSGLLAGSSFAETVKDREGAVRSDAKKMTDSERWIYNDIEAGFAESRKTGKPLMVVLRCVPCLACMGIDTEVLMENRDLTPLMDQFVRVRVINANSLDLSLFQFDYDLSFSVLFFHPDKTIYGRFGSWEHQKDSQMKTTSGFKQAMERVLALHKNIETYRPMLAGKKGKPMPYKTPVDMPQLKGKYRSELDWNGQVVKSCVHCHQIGDVARLDRRDRGETLPLELIAPYPSPESVGFVMKQDQVTTVKEVQPGSPAEQAGFQRDDTILFFGGQPLVSVADLSWVLHHVPENGSVEVMISRDGKKEERTLPLQGDWREGADISRRVGTWPMRAMAFGGMKLEELDESARRRAGIEEGKLALEAIHVGQYNKHAAAKRQGFLEGDIIVEVDGNDEAMTESQLLIKNMRNRKPGEKVPTVVLRKRKRVELQMPIQ